MGIYLNPGNENFTRDARSKYYVDKTMMIRAVNEIMESENNYICVSRPRRFGKTIAGDMLSAYYSRGCDSRELFQGFKIAEEPDFAEKLNRYNVIKIDMNSEYRNSKNKSRIIDELTEKIKDEMREVFPGVKLLKKYTLAECIIKLYAQKKEVFIIIIDEYDVLVRENVEKSLFEKYLDFLNGLFKSGTLRPAITLAYLTGILPIVRDKIQSKLNNFDEYTILSAGCLTEFVGFTDDEVKTLCGKHGMDIEECRRWYDGYRLNELEVYNPESVVKSMRNRIYGNYWGKTSTYQVIAEYIRKDFKGIRNDVVRMLSGERVNVDVEMYMNTMTDFINKDDVFTYLIHLGYLAYTMEDETCWIPNREVRLEWFRAISTVEDYTETDRIIKASKELLTETLRGNEDAVSKALNESHIHVTSNRSYNNEDALQSAIYLSYIYALNEYTVTKEMTAGKGFADVTFIPYKPDIPAMIIELKRNDSADSAIGQIRDRQYYKSLEKYSGNLLFVGINYDEKDKTHSCRIERFVK